MRQHDKVLNLNKIFIIQVLVFIIVFFMTCQVSADNSELRKGAWIEIPEKKFITQNKSSEEVMNLLDKYHVIDKTKLEFLNNRIHLLKEICQKIRALEAKYDRKELGNLAKLLPLAEKKLWYLQQIHNIYNNKNLFDVFVEAKKEKDNYQQIYLVNKVLFDFNLPTLWGLFPLDVIDPCHRMLTAHYLNWQKYGKKIPFFLWLETQEMSFRTLQMKFFSEREIAESEIIIEQGFFKSATTKELSNFNNKNKEYIYSLSLDKKIIVAEGGELVRHICLSHGKPVLGSGALKIKNGNLVFIDIESGHYQPTPEVLYQVLQILKDKGANLDYKKIEVAYYLDHNKIYSNAESFMKLYKDSKVKNTTNDTNIVLNI